MMQLITLAYFRHCSFTSLQF